MEEAGRGSNGRQGFDVTLGYRGASSALARSGSPSGFAYGLLELKKGLMCGSVESKCSWQQCVMARTASWKSP